MGFRAEAVIVGAELLLGQAEANAPVLSRRLLSLGGDLARVTVVGDEDPELQDAVEGAAGRSALVVVAGGLGPTEDDRTRYALARAAGAPLVLREDLLDGIRAPFERMGREMPPSNRVQALLPSPAEAIPNPVGTAPGFALEVGGAWVVALPGVPREFRHLLDGWVVPMLRRRFGGGAAATRLVRVSGLGESAVGEAVADLMGVGLNPYVGTLATPGEVKVLLVARAGREDEARRLLDGSEAEVRKRLGAHVVGTDEETHAAVALRTAAAAGWEVASAEGFTGGILASWLWRARDDCFRGGVVEPARVLRGRFGALGDSARAIRAMAEDAARTHGASVGVAAASEVELVPQGGGNRCWVGVWRDGAWRVRSLPLVFGTGADEERCCHQALYEIRNLAARPGCGSGLRS